MEGSAVGGGEGEVQAELVGVVPAGGVARGCVGALQSTGRRRRADPLEPVALVEDQAGLRQRDDVAAAGPAEQGVAVRSIVAHPAALRRLAVGERAWCGGGGNVGGRGVARAVARHDAIEVGGGRGEPCVRERGAGAGPDLGPSGAAVGRTLDLVGGGSAGGGPAEADIGCVDSPRAQPCWRRRGRKRRAAGGDGEVLRGPLREAEDPPAAELVAAPHHPRVDRVGRGRRVVTPTTWIGRAVALKRGLLIGGAARTQEDLTGVHLAERCRFGPRLCADHRQERGACAVVGDHRVVAR